TLINGLFAGLQQFDSRGVDGTVNGVAKGAMAGGRAIRKAHTGQLQLYGLTKNEIIMKEKSGSKNISQTNSYGITVSLTPLRQYVLYH
ncbi:unnamed protein product, partial [marine sediment metagenome]